MYFISRDVQLKRAVAFAYGDSLTTGVTTVAQSEVAKVVEAQDQGGDNVESEEGAEFLKMSTYFISCPILAERVLMPLLLHTISVFCL